MGEVQECVERPLHILFKIFFEQVTKMIVDIDVDVDIDGAIDWRTSVQC